MCSPQVSRNPVAGQYARTAAALECYLSSILYIAETLEAISPEIGAAYFESLISLRSQVSADPSGEQLAESCTALHEILRGFSEKARLQNEALARDLNQTLAMVTRTEDTSAGRNVQYIEQLVEFADRMESAVQSADLPELAARTAELREFAKSIAWDNRGDFDWLRQKMTDIQRRLREVELLATLDPLTGVANRRDLDRELASRIEGGQEFCLLLFDLNGFKDINDRWGHLSGDEILKQLSARLSSQVRAHDYVCRWGGDEFVVILACDLAIAESRSRQIAERLNGRYFIGADGHEVRVDVAVTVGLVPYRCGETPAQLFRRVDAAMYRQKHSVSAG